jgi:spermidine/putrescine transport system substrate-binding protein
MHDCGDKTEDMLAMWSRVKGDNLSAGLVWFIGAVVAIIIGISIFRAISNKHKKDQQRKRRRNRR